MNSILHRALLNKEKLEMIYMNHTGDISHRVIKVLAYDHERLKAYCYTRRQFRTFKLDRILSVHPVRQRWGA